MKIEEDEMSDDLKSKINGEITQTAPYRDGYAVDTIIAAQDITKDLGESNKKNKKLDMIKRPINKGIATKLVGDTKLKKPVGKLSSSLPIMGEKEETFLNSLGLVSVYYITCYYYVNTVLTFIMSMYNYFSHNIYIDCRTKG